MTKPSRNTRQHAKEWSDFFRHNKKATETIVETFIKRYKKRKYLAQSLTRLIKRGFLEKKGKFFKPTKAGLRFFRKLSAEKVYSAFSWDGKWRLVSFDVPGGYNRARDQIRGLLGEFDFQPLHKSVWISPESVSEDFWKIIVENELDKYCKTMVVEILEGGEQLFREFRLKREN